MDFYKIKERNSRSGLEVYPDFQVCKSKDLMVRGKAFYAVWDAEAGLWSTDEFDIQRLVDADLRNYASKISTDERIKVKYLSDNSSNSWNQFKNYVNKFPDCFHQLDNSLIFSNTKVKKNDYASRKLPYPLEEGSIEAYEELISTLYLPEEREKIEWAIGSIVAGDSKDIQKFIVFYGEAGTGKSTIINIIQKLFDGYYTIFDAKALTSNGNSFATEVFKTNPLVAIQHDGDLSKIEDNTRLNSIVSHEEIIINEKYKSAYSTRSNCFLFMATNRPVKITDAKSGIIRRLIDVRPSGKRIPPKKYQALISQIDFELGAIADHCLKVYRSLGKNYYSNYRPLDMILQTDVFYNFVEANFDIFKEQDETTLTAAYEMYKQYCDESLVDYKLARYKFREELKDYFAEFYPITRVGDKQTRSVYRGFLTSKFTSSATPKNEDLHPNSLVMDKTVSLFDELYSDCKAQLATEEGNPMRKWENVRTTLSDIDTRKLHYVMVPKNHIVIDFDLKDENGEKSFERNLEAASKWPPTYGELSKSEKGIHLHYIFDGDVETLSRLYSEGIEIKVFTGNSSLRRKLTKCNGVPIAHINSGLPLKGDNKPVINFDGVKSERALRRQIEKNLNKEVHAGTKPSVDFIFKILEDAYASDLSFDITDMRPRVLAFANNSTHHAEYCVKLVNKMHFMSKDIELELKNKEDKTKPIIFFDVEVFPNLFVVVYKKRGKEARPVKLINPSSSDIERLLNFNLIGFNCRRYDNHILYARLIGYNNLQLYELSQRIISGSKNAMFGQAYNISYTDVYDFSSKKQSLKKFEIELDIHHQELGLKWDEPVPEELWKKVAEYCINDVVATEAVFEARHDDFVAREILADIAGMTVNDTTNSLTTKIIFGDNKNPQSSFMYRDLSKPVKTLPADVLDFLKNEVNLKIPFNSESLLPYFPGYEFKNGKSTYRGEEVGEGGYVYAEPGIHGEVGLDDISSMHPSSIIDECLFGPIYTKRFKDIRDARILIKHGEFDKAKKMFGGKLEKYLSDSSQAKSLSGALKIAINSVYGLTSASFTNPFRDIRNVDNIVAKRGALFMIDLKNAVKDQGYTVAHIKTDSIKIPDCTNDILAFVDAFGLDYGYSFEHEATYNKMCLVNDAVYIAKYSDDKKVNKDKAGTWTATGAQFQQSYVFKTLFSKEPLEFKDFCETRNVTTALYLDMNEDLPDVSKYEAEADKLRKKISDPRLSEELMTEEQARLDELREIISSGHSYHFVGRSGLFCPIKPGKGGGILLREKDGKYYSAPSSKGYRWMESEMVRNLHKEEDIDHGYYKTLIDEAVSSISQYGDFEWFASESPYLSIKSDTLPF